jgi:hypothetical protein
MNIPKIIRGINKKTTNPRLRPSCKFGAASEPNAFCFSLKSFSSHSLSYIHLGISISSLIARD